MLFDDLPIKNFWRRALLAGPASGRNFSAANFLESLLRWSEGLSFFFGRRVLVARRSSGQGWVLLNVSEQDVMSMVLG